MKKIQIFSINSKKIIFYITKILCHHVEHTLFYLWLKYESIWTNVLIHLKTVSVGCGIPWDTCYDDFFAIPVGGVVGPLEGMEAFPCLAF
jgi:hypothetical protein